MKLLFKIIIGLFLKQNTKGQAVPSGESGVALSRAKVKDSRKKKLFWWAFIILYIYPALIPALFAYAPEAVTAWLDAWHILFGTLPAIAAFISEAQPMVDKHGLSMPYSYYIHGFWVYLGTFGLCIYGLCRAGFPDESTLGHKAHHFLFLATPCVSFLFVFAVFGGWGLDLLFEYSESVGGLAKWMSTWWGFQYQPLFIVLGGFMCVLNLMSYYSSKSRFLRWLNHKSKNKEG